MNKRKRSLRWAFFYGVEQLEVDRIPGVEERAAEVVDREEIG